MKKISDIIGLPAVDLSSGNRVGTIWSVIVNGEKGTVDFFVIDDGMIILGAKVVAASDIQGIGEHALTISRGETFRKITEVEQAVDIFKKNIRIKGSKVLTQKGRLIGEIGEFYIDENSCMIAAMEFLSPDSPDRVRIIHRDQVVTFGENLIVVVEDIEKHFEIMPAVNINEELNVKVNDSKQTPDIIPGETDKDKKTEQDEQDDEQDIVQIDTETDEEFDEAVETDDLDFETDETVTSEEVPQPEDMVEESPEIVESDEKEKDKKDAVVVKAAAKNQKEKDSHHVDDTFKEGISARTCTVKEETQEKPHEKKVHANKPAEHKTSNIFEQKQKEFLMGRKATKVIKDKSGNVILNHGDVINEEAVEKAKEDGKLIEIIMNNRA